MSARYTLVLLTVGLGWRWADWGLPVIDFQYLDIISRDALFVAPVDTAVEDALRR